jgi:hypothetical protein
MVNFHENFVIATLKVKELISYIYIYIFDIYCSHGVFSKIQKQFIRTIHTLLSSFFLAFTQCLTSSSKIFIIA